MRAYLPLCANLVLAARRRLRTSRSAGAGEPPRQGSFRGGHASCIGTRTRPELALGNAPSSQAQFAEKAALEQCTNLRHDGREPPAGKVGHVERYRG